MNIRVTGNSMITYKSLTSPHIFLFKLHLSHLALRILNSLLGLGSEAIFSHKITKEKYENTKSRSPSRLQQGHEYTVGAIKQEGSVALFNLSCLCAP